MEKHNSGPHFSSFSVLIIFFVSCLIGFFFIPIISVRLFPTQKRSVLKVSCYIRDASPEVTDSELTSLLEDGLASLKGIKNIYSVSGKGQATLTIELDKFVNIDNFRLEASEILRQLYPKLPKGASYPELSLNKPSSNRDSENSILAYNLSGPGDYTEILENARKIFTPSIAKLHGLKQFAIDGDKTKEIVIIPNLQKIESLNLTLVEVESAIRSGIDVRDMGLVKTKIGKINLQVSGQLKKQNDLYNYPIRTKNGRLVVLKDIADIKIADTPKDYYFRINGNDVVSLKFYPADGVNTIELTSQIKKVMSDIEKRLPENYKLGLTYDNTQAIKDELQSIYYRTFLSVLILLIFVLILTREWRYLIIIVSSLLCNILISIVFYYLFKLDIHSYSLAGITISLGMVVDNSVILIAELKNKSRARIFPAILASTTTALGALSVVYLVKGDAKVDLTDFATAILINLIVSLPISYFFIPAILEMLPLKIVKANTEKKKLKAVWFEKFYKNQTIFMLNFRKTFLTFFILCFGLPFYLLPEKIEEKGLLSKSYNATFGSSLYNNKLRAPINKYLGGVLFLYFKGITDSYTKYGNESRTMIRLDVTMPNGSTLSQMNGVCKDFEKYIQQFRERLDISLLNIENANKAQISIFFKEANIVEKPILLTPSC